MKQIIKKISSFLLAVVLLFGLFSTAFVQRREVLADDPWSKILEIKKEQEALAANREALAAELSVLEDEEALKTSQYAWILERSEVEREKYLKRVNQLYRVYLNMESVKASLAQAIEMFEAKKQQYGERIGTMFRMQQKSLLELFLEADTLEGFFTTIKFMKIVNAADAEALASLSKAAENLEQQKELEAGKYQEMSAMVDVLEADILAMQKEVDAAAAEATAAQIELMNKIDTMSSYNALEEELKGQLQEYELALRNMQHQNIALSFNGILGWPCPGYSAITSGFGPRYIPSIGLNDFHTGLDMAAPVGTPVYAASGGYVYFASYGNISGNTVRIDHGDGLHTLYCHLSGFNCYVGQMVNAGDLIGYVGLTGLTTGPHLHFQVEVNGVAVDPTIYLY
ncbi:MAG: peptidoglycan DD-metalloendopeptidase family protein [Eubacteriales bacterium]|nr:peptidoglycan DD-metalloendopeptidase family protein [Eubacteriales bacterium]